MILGLMPQPKIQFMDNNGNPLSGGKLYTYQPGTTTGKNSYLDSAGNTINANPVILDAYGRASVWLDGYYDMVLTDANGNQIWTQSNVYSQIDQTLTLSEWVDPSIGNPSMLPYAYINAYEFSANGDVRSLFPINTRVKTQGVSGDYIYGYVFYLTYSAGKTSVYIIWDNSTDALLSTFTNVYTGIFSASHLSIPANAGSIFIPSSYTNLVMYNNVSSPTTKIDVTYAGTLKKGSYGTAKASGSFTIDITTVGVNGRDRSALSSGWWDIRVIATDTINQSTGILSAAGLATPFGGTPQIPSGYTYSSDVLGSFFVDGSNHLVTQYQTMNISHITTTQILSGGNATSLTAVSPNAAVPYQAKKLFLQIQNTSTGTVSFTGHSSLGIRNIAANSSAVLTLPLQANGSGYIYYLVSGASTANIWVAGWEY